MILQYEMNGKEIYREAEQIVFSEIVAVGKPFDDVYSVLDFAKEQIKYTPDTIEICSPSLEDKDRIKEMKTVKMVVLSNGLKKKDNETLLFDEQSESYLLNNNGKTLKKF